LRLRKVAVVFVGTRFSFKEFSGAYQVQKIKRALQLTLSDWRYLMIASVELLAARFRLATVATDKILQEFHAPLSPLYQEKRSRFAKVDVQRLSWAIVAAAQRVPWRSDCLIQAIAADRWLRRHQLRPDFYLGVAKDKHGTFAAHAWLCYGDLIVTGNRFSQFSALMEPTPK
jgi:Transglutaminase-like superfamily